MRLWHLTLSTLLLAVVLTIAREPAGAVSLVVFFCGIGEVVLGTTVLMMLFQALAAVGYAEGFVDHVEAVAVSFVILVIGAGLMLAWLFVGAWLVFALSF
jgi:hypothetical protein